MGLMRRRTSWAAAALSAAVLAGCGVGDPATVGPSGVDGLVIPTPSPDPADFVPAIDNPWLPLAEGSRWRYRVVEDGRVTERVTVTVAGEGEQVAGVDATVVREVVRGADGELVEKTRGWFAEDADGNVWQLGTDGTGGSWEAGLDGAQAGLAMPSTPRVGDGFELEHAPGTAEDRARVMSLGAEATVPAGAFTGLVETEVTTPLEPGLERRASYAEGVGLVRLATVAGGSDGAAVVELVSHTTTPTPR